METETFQKNNRCRLITACAKGSSKNWAWGEGGGSVVFKIL